MSTRASGTNARWRAGSRLPAGLPPTFHAAPAHALPTSQAIGRRRFRRDRGIPLAQRELTLQIFNLVRLIGDLRAQALMLPTQALEFRDGSQCAEALSAGATVAQDPAATHASVPNHVVKYKRSERSRFFALDSRNSQVEALRRYPASPSQAERVAEPRKEFRTGALVPPASICSRLADLCRAATELRICSH